MYPVYIAGMIGTCMAQAGVEKGQLQPLIVKNLAGVVHGRASVASTTPEALSVLQ